MVRESTSATSSMPLVVIVGPTASGKTAFSIALARAIGGEIINTDSVLTYRGMDIGSAKPSISERGEIPHHLIDIWEVDHDATVAEFQERARAAISEVRSRDRVPILVGGSALYIRAVIDPLDFPGTDPTIRAAWQTRADELGAEALHAILAQKDPAAAEQILASNQRRVVRALEVIEMTGQPFKASLPDYTSIYPNLVMVGLDIDRLILDERIATRVNAMWSAGFVDEVRQLSGLAQSPTASRAIGYQQVLAYLSGEHEESTAIELTISGTKRLARRQDRMLHKDPRTQWFNFDDPQLLARAIAAIAATVDPVG